MFNAKSEFVNTKTVLCFPKTLLFLVAIVTGAFAVPVHPKYFPEQDLVSCLYIGSYDLTSKHKTYKTFLID